MGYCPDDIKEQVDLVFQRTFEILRWVGLTKDDLVEIYSYHVDLPNNFDQFIEVKNRHLTSNFRLGRRSALPLSGCPNKIEMRSIAAFRD